MIADIRQRLAEISAKGLPEPDAMEVRCTIETLYLPTVMGWSPDRFRLVDDLPPGLPWLFVWHRKVASSQGFAGEDDAYPCRGSWTERRDKLAIQVFDDTARRPHSDENGRPTNIPKHWGWSTRVERHFVMNVFADEARLAILKHHPDAEVKISYGIDYMRGGALGVHVESEPVTDTWWYDSRDTIRLTRNLRRLPQRLEQMARESRPTP